MQKQLNTVTILVNVYKLKTFAQSALLHMSRRNQIFISTKKNVLLYFWCTVPQKDEEESLWQTSIIRLFLCRRERVLAAGPIWSWYEEKLSQWLSSRIIKWTRQRQNATSVLASSNQEALGFCIATRSKTMEFLWMTQQHTIVLVFHRLWDYIHLQCTHKQWILKLKLVINAIL